MHRRGTRRRKWWIGLPVAVALPALPVPPTGNAPVVHAGTVPPVVLEFDFHRRGADVDVPAGVTEATFDVLGAQGGSGNIEQGPAGHPGGLGGRDGDDRRVTPGSTVTIMVGGKGDDFVDDPMICNTQGGFNGGGDAGAQNGDEGFCGQGGGGASDVRIGGTNLDNRVLVAGGGGGASVNLLCLVAGEGGRRGHVGGVRRSWCRRQPERFQRQRSAWRWRQRWRPHPSARTLGAVVAVATTAARAARRTA